MLRSLEPGPLGHQPAVGWTPQGNHRARGPDLTRALRRLQYPNARFCPTRTPSAEAHPDSGSRDVSGGAVVKGGPGPGAQAAPSWHGLALGSGPPRQKKGGRAGAENTIPTSTPGPGQGPLSLSPLQGCPLLPLILKLWCPSRSGRQDKESRGVDV